MLFVRRWNGMTGDQISDLEINDNPPLSSPWDPIQIASQTWSANANSFTRKSQNV